MTLENLRKEIDELNVKIIELLAKRVEITCSIARLKKEYGLPLVDRHRESLQYENLKKLREKFHLPDEMVEKIFTLIVEYCKQEMQKELMK